MKKIVILDGYALNPGDLSWNELRKLGNCTIYDRTDPDRIVERAKEAEIVLINKTVIDRQSLLNLPQLKYIGVMATGTNVVDTEFARARGIVVTNVRNYAGRSSSQMVFALILELTHRIGHHSQTVFNNKWSESQDFCYWDYPLIELDGLTIGIIGFGGIGKHVATIANAFGMHVLVSTRTIPQPAPEGIEFCELDPLFEQSDIISLHCPLTKETEGLINTDRLVQMKNNAFLINVSRGQLVVEQALADALNSGQIAGAGLDVLATEPADPKCPLLKSRNCFITPHFAWATHASRSRLLQMVVSNVASYLDGNPQNVIK
ncbi:D-2-hydroxyacid dehydrogenase [bacterium]|nr:D-2-hydroxyacid dehydrogenase [bacterium]